VIKLNFLNEYYGSKKPIESLEVNELLEILKNFKKREIQKHKNNEKFQTTKIDKAIETTSKLNLKGISLLTKWIDILKENGYWEDSDPMIELSNRYGSQVFDIYIKHSSEVPVFIRKGVDF